MSGTTLLIVLLSHGGHWLAGTDADITVQWAARVNMPDAVVIWELKYGTVTAASGQSNLAGANASGSGGKALITIKVPEVRVRIPLHLVYRVVKRDGGNELAHGESTIQAFPANLLRDYAAQYARRSVVLLNRGGSLSNALAMAKIAVTSVTDATNLAIDPPDVLIVSPDAIGPSPFDALPLEAIAAAGTQTLVFRQTRCQRIGPYALADRRPDDAVKWNSAHPLLDGLEPATLDALLTAGPGLVKVVQLPPAEPALDIGSFRSEAPGNGPTPVDAVILTKTIGSGRLILIQLPTDDFDTDPRAIMLLNNALSYVLTRPQPTPAPDQKTAGHGTGSRAVSEVHQHQILIGG